MKLREVKNPILKDLFCGDRSSSPSGFDLSKINLVGSGKAGIALILDYLKKKGVLCNKLDEVLVPDWLGSWVYSQMQASAFPAKKFSSRIKILFVYHQYGFPQNMDKIMEFAQDKNLVVIEDCAHALKSYYHDRELGSFGDFSLYSFSKWFFCFACGGVKSTSGDFSEFVNEKQKSVPGYLTFMKDLLKYIYEVTSFGDSKFLQKRAALGVKMSYAIYGDALRASRLAVKLVARKLDREIEVRQKRYHHFLKTMDNLGICDHLEKTGITPYVIPIIAPVSKLEKILKKFISINIESNIYNFDINRNLLEPNFVPCLWIPCHAGITDKKFSEITEVIIKEISK